MSDGDKERLIKKVMLDEPKTQRAEAAQRDAVLEEVIEALEARAKDRSEMASRGDEGAAYEADWTRSLYPLIRALKGNADLQDVVVASGRSEGIPAPAESASRVETRACYRECKGPISEGCEYPRCLSGSASRCVAVPDHVLDFIRECASNRMGTTLNQQARARRILSQYERPSEG